MPVDGTPMTKDFPVFDCDGHILEPDVIWRDYVEPEYREAVRAGCWKEDQPDGSFEFTVNGILYAKREGEQAFFGAILTPGMDKDKLSRVKMGVDQVPIAPGAYDPRARLRDMDLMGIDQAMIIPTFCGMWFTAIQDPRAALGLARAYNNWALDYCKADPARLFPAAVIPQQDLDDAVGEVRRVGDLGFTCVLIRPNIVADRYPAHPSFDPVWQAVLDHDLVAGVHPFPAAGGRGPAPADCTAEFIDRAAQASALRRGMVAETICFAQDAQTFLLMLFHHDWYARFPRLKLAVLESNASWLPYVLEKADGRVRAWTATRGTTVTTVPSEAFYRSSFIGFESDEETVFEVWHRFEDIAVWASDYPHFDAEDGWEGIAHMRKWKVPEHVIAKMMGGNALRMYGIEPKLAVREQLPVPEVRVPA